MVGKRARLEDAYGRGSRDPRAMVKGRRLAPQSPAMEAPIPRSAPEAGPPGERAETADARTRRCPWTRWIILRDASGDHPPGAAPPRYRAASARSGGTGGSLWA